ncbi:virulence RhuM family protein [Tissierella creatinophila]|uniref:Bro-N domain-containing protein n=1 Tax=Tissierella creatinophila DSM 6911 TaxID=1123403 RepID=A0A1U7M6K7_TISCR|nr:virulence RhuM family protein [Tissierella creatinophila]OLS02921.1 hypothetical protein TICRE_10750 [Tissierella creatinophila DSM 6911]
MSGENEILIYQTDGGDVKVDVMFQEETFWMPQKAIAELFDVDISTINEHLKNIYSSNELDKNSTIRKFPIVQTEGNRRVTRNINFYNLDAIIAVGYRVNSYKATQFRKWATKTLKEYITKGFVLNEKMLKNTKPFGKDYFDELLEKVREIRASERRFYQKITDIYSQFSYDYDKDAPTTRAFFKEVQNKLLFAVTDKTAPEIIYERADSKKENMGLTTWKNSPEGKILKSDTTVSKNYLYEKEIRELNRIVNMYLDYAENQAERHQLMSMEDWKNKLDAFLEFNEYDILKNLGNISRKVADATAHTEYNKFRIIQDKMYESDFDKLTKEIKKLDK